MHTHGKLCIFERRSNLVCVCSVWNVLEGEHRHTEARSYAEWDGFFWLEIRVIVFVALEISTQSISYENDSACL